MKKQEGSSLGSFLSPSWLTLATYPRAWVILGWGLGPPPCPHTRRLFPPLTCGTWLILSARLSSTLCSHGFQSPPQHRPPRPGILPTQPPVRAAHRALYSLGVQACRTQTESVSWLLQGCPGGQLRLGVTSPGWHPQSLWTQKMPQACRLRDGMQSRVLEEPPEAGLV